MAFPIIQFGTSRFLQAHVDLFVSEALAAGEAIGRIVAVQTTANVASRKRIAAFAEGRPYVVQIKGIAAGAIVDREIEVGSVGGGVNANLDWCDVERLFNEARCMVSNTADRGYETDDRTGRTVHRRAPSRPSSQGCCWGAAALAPHPSRSFPAS